MRTKLTSGASGWVDPDDAPELDNAFFDKAEVKMGEAVVKRGRPKIEKPKVQVSLRLDQDVVEFFRAGGEGWQTRLNDALRDAAAKGDIGNRGRLIVGTRAAAAVLAEAKPARPASPRGVPLVGTFERKPYQKGQGGKAKR